MDDAMITDALQKLGDRMFERANAWSACRDYVQIADEASTVLGDFAADLDRLLATVREVQDMKFCEVCGATATTWLNDRRVCLEHALEGAVELLKPTEARAPHEPPAHIIQFAIEASTSSPCRSKRGVAIFRSDDLVSQGYNYKPRGFDCEQTDACKATCRVEAVHAEQQALLIAGRKAEGADLLHVKSVGGQLVASGGPSCVECSKLARASGIAGVWLYHADGWRRYEMVEFHRLSLQAQEAQEARAAQPLDLKKAEDRTTVIFRLALERIVRLDLKKDEHGRDDFYSGPDRFFQVWNIARSALDQAALPDPPAAVPQASE